MLAYGQHAVSIFVWSCPIEGGLILLEDFFDLLSGHPLSRLTQKDPEAPLLGLCTSLHVRAVKLPSGQQLLAVGSNCVSFLLRHVLESAYSVTDKKLLINYIF